MQLYRIISTLIFTCFLSSQAFAATYEAYVTNLSSGSVSVLSLPEGNLVMNIPVGNSPLYIQSNPAMNRVYVINNTFFGTVTVIDTSTHNVIATIPVGNTPNFSAITPNGNKLYVTNSGSNTVSVIDTVTNTVISTIPTGGIQPLGIVITPNGQKVYVGNATSGTASVINTATDTVITTVPIVANSQIPAVTPDGTAVYFPSITTNNLSVINTSTDTVSTVGVTGVVTRVTISPDGTKAYAPCTTSIFVDVVDTSTLTVTNTILVGNLPNTTAFSQDGQTAYVTNYGSNSISVIDVPTATVTSTVPSATRPLDIKLTPDTTQMAITFSTLSPGGFGLLSTSTNLFTATTPVEDFTFFLAFGRVAPTTPTDLTGVQRKNKFAYQTDIYNVLTWTTPPDTTVAYYLIYRDNLDTLIGIVPADGILSYEDHNRSAGKLYRYFVIAVDDLGNQSDPATVVVAPSRTNSCSAN